MINIHVSKYASFDLNTPPHTDNDIHIFTQFFVHSNPTRKREIQFCLQHNANNPQIKSIHLLNEKIYGETELFGEHTSSIPSPAKNKITQSNISETADDKVGSRQRNVAEPRSGGGNIDRRLTFKDIFQYIRLNKIAGYCVFTNADIFFDETLAKVRFSTLHTHKHILALLRYEFGGGRVTTETAPIFGPRFDSQDTWILHFARTKGGGGCVHCSSLNIKEKHEPAFNIEFGRPGCDNKIAYLFNVLGSELFNDPQFIKTYHNHSSTLREYSKDVIGQPYTVILPAGVNPYIIAPSLGIDCKRVIETTKGFKEIRFDDNRRLFQYISDKLGKREKFIIPRISGHENNYAMFGKIIQSNMENGVKQIPVQIQQYFQQTLPTMKKNAGIKLSSLNDILKYSQMYLKAFENCDLYGGWESWGQYMPHISNSHQFIQTTFPTKQIFWTFALDIYHYIYDVPFTLAMKGKRVLIVSPFVQSIQEKLKNRALIYDGVDLFPDCSFLFIVPPLTNGDNPSEDFGVELERFFRRLDELRGEYDIALLSCGGYANPIANYIYENHEASAIYVGGVLQMYFGIYGVRWLKERADVLKLFMNENWSRPSAVEKPQNYGSIENGCYW